MDTKTRRPPNCAKQRVSNFELLRIAAMMFIVAHHFLIATGKVDYYSPTACGGELANSFLVCGVDCFILISGYFGIKPNAAKFLWLALLIALTLLAEALLAAIPATGGLVNLPYAIHRIVPFFKDSNWFIPSYIGLMLLSPILNKALDNAPQKELSLWTAALTLLCLYSYFFSITPVDTTGYNLIQFIYLYILGRFLRRNCPDVKIPPAAAMYVGGSLLAYAVSVFVKPGFTAFAYNSPQILLSSCGLFLLFKNIRLRSKAINAAASTMFCVFLFHYSIIYNVKGGCPTAKIVLVYLASFAGGMAIGALAKLMRQSICRRNGNHPDAREKMSDAGKAT